MTIYDHTAPWRCGLEGCETCVDKPTQKEYFDKRTYTRVQVYECPHCHSTKTIYAHATQSVAEFQQSLPKHILCGVKGCLFRATKKGVPDGN